MGIGAQLCGQAGTSGLLPNIGRENPLRPQQCREQHARNREQDRCQRNYHQHLEQAPTAAVCFRFHGRTSRWGNFQPVSLIGETRWPCCSQEISSLTRLPLVEPPGSSVMLAVSFAAGRFSCTAGENSCPSIAATLTSSHVAAITRSSRLESSSR